MVQSHIPPFVSQLVCIPNCGNCRFANTHFWRGHGGVGSWGKKARESYYQHLTFQNAGSQQPMLRPCSFDGGESHHPVDPALLPAGPWNAVSNELIIVSLIKWVFDWGKQFDHQRGDKEKQAKHLTWKPSNLHLHLERRETHTGWAPQELCPPHGLVWLRAQFIYKLCRPSLA